MSSCRWVSYKNKYMKIGTWLKRASQSGGQANLITAWMGKISKQNSLSKVKRWGKSMLFWELLFNCTGMCKLYFNQLIFASRKDQKTYDVIAIGDKNPYKGDIWQLDLMMKWKNHEWCNLKRAVVFLAR